MTALRTLVRPLAAPWLVALLLRAALLASFTVTPTWDGAIYARAADDIGAGRGFTRSALSRSQPSVPMAFYPVGLPAVLAPMRWLGLGRRGDVVLQCLLGSLLVPITALIARRAGGRRTARWAAWIVALWPGGVLLSLSWLTEPLFSVLVGLASLVLVWSRRRSRLRAIALASLLLGAAAYVRPTALPILGMLVVGTLWVDRSLVLRTRAWHSLAVPAVIVALVIAPWAVRNAHAIGAPIPLSTNGGFNLLVGSYGEGRYTAIPDEVDCPRTLGEVAKDRCRLRLAWARIAARPGDAAARSLLRVTNTFGQESDAPESWAESIQASDPVRASARLWALGVCHVYWLGLLAASLAGVALLLALRRSDIVTVALLAPLAGTMALHGAVIGGDRYHAQTVPMIATCAAIAIIRLARARARVRGTPEANRSS